MVDGIGSEFQTLRDVVRAFADREIRPYVAAMEAAEAIPLALVDRLGDLGVFATPFPPEYGGAGMGERGFVIVQEELARAHASTGLLVAASSGLAGRLLNMFGTSEQKERYLVPLARGHLIGAFCLTEPSAGSDVPALAMRATADGDAFLLDGEKAFITSGDRAGVLLVFAKTEPSAGRHGISLFIVEGGTSGLSVLRLEDKMGLRASSTAALAFDGVRVPRANLVGELGAGFTMALACLNHSRIGIAAMCLGVAREALDLGWRYAHERSIGGQVLGGYQVTQHALADMAVDVYATACMVYHTAAMADAGESIEAEASMCKVFATEAAQRVVDRALQLHGGLGYTRGADIERLYRDIRAARIYEGANEVQRNNIYRLMRHQRG